MKTISEPINQSWHNSLTYISDQQSEWISEGWLGISFDVVNRARNAINDLSKHGQRISMVSPGPKGEVSINNQVGIKTLELLFYPSKSKFVKLDGNTLSGAQQGEYKEQELPILLDWLNSPSRHAKKNN